MPKPCLYRLNCPGDRGRTTALYKGRAVEISKDSLLAEFFGVLETAEAYVFAAASLLPRRQARAMRLIGFALAELGFYMATGSAERYAKALELYGKALKIAHVVSKRPAGWIYCRTLQCAFADLARAWIRTAERRAAALGDLNAVRLLNYLSNTAFEIMASL